MISVIEYRARRKGSPSRLRVTAGSASCVRIAVAVAEPVGDRGSRRLAEHEDGYDETDEAITSIVVFDAARGAKQNLHSWRRFRPRRLLWSVDSAGPGCGPKIDSSHTVTSMTRRRKRAA
jgi:hypothetical protein